MQALRVELHAMEASAASFTASLEHSPSPEQLTGMKQHLEGRFRFLWGIYRAHSEVRTAWVARCGAIPGGTLRAPALWRPPSSRLMVWMARHPVLMVRD